MEDGSRLDVTRLDPFLVVNVTENWELVWVNITIYHHTGVTLHTGWMGPVEYRRFVEANDAADKCRATTLPEDHEYSIQGRTIDPR
jgi:hypothetical protein